MGSLILQNLTAETRQDTLGDDIFVSINELYSKSASRSDCLPIIELKTYKNY